MDIAVRRFRSPFTVTVAQITNQESTMASKQSQELVDLFKRMSGAIAADPQMSMADIRAVLEHGGDATTEPRDVDYIEVDPGGVPAIWAVPKACPQNRVLLSSHYSRYLSRTL